SSMYRSFHPDDGISRCGSTIDRSVTSYSMWRSDHAVTLRLFVAPGEFARVWRLRLPVGGPGRSAGGSFHGETLSNGAPVESIVPLTVPEETRQRRGIERCHEHSDRIKDAAESQGRSSRGVHRQLCCGPASAGASP